MRSRWIPNHQTLALEGHKQLAPSKFRGSPFRSEGDGILRESVCGQADAEGGNQVTSQFYRQGVVQRLPNPPCEMTSSDWYVEWR